MARRSIHELWPAEAGTQLADSEVVGNESGAGGLGLIDRVIALRRVPMLSNLDPEDLQLIAEATEETTYLAGESIYRAGEPGKEMLVIIDGEVVVTTEHDGNRREVARYGPGQHVGELALLQESVRSADVGAGDEGLSALVITDVDLESILQERPTVAIAMLRTLATRLAEQT